MKELVKNLVGQHIKTEAVKIFQTHYATLSLDYWFPKTKENTKLEGFKI